MRIREESGGVRQHDVIGQLTVIGPPFRCRQPNGRVFYRVVCRCSCGTVTCPSTANLKTGRNDSCGCVSARRIGNLRRTHGQYRTRLYRIWKAMNKRCRNPNAINYKWYGGKGVTVCSEWEKNYEPFQKWALNNGYQDHLTIERKDPNKSYCPSNCEWITRAENASHARKGKACLK